VQLSFGEEHRAFRARLREWLEANVPRDAAAPMPGSEEEVAYLRAWQQKLFSAGWCGLTWPKEYGGRGVASSNR